MNIWNARLLLAVLVLAFPSIAAAAIVIKPNVACKAEADSKKLLDLGAKNDKAGVDKFSAPKLAAGDCFSLFKAMNVDVDKKDGKLLCVRPTGGFDCYWAADDSINQNPTSEHETRAQSGGRRRGGGMGPPMN
ncbi:hypothetical protein [Methylocella sp.]|jgi:hypothetical protein|uniref:hypothetical protein n=1 Tax=Methylocella sp. TaxID=1978226 RepID=UPI003C1EA0FA